MKTRIGDISIQIRGVSYKPSDISDENDPQSIAILRANTSTIASGRPLRPKST